MLQIDILTIFPQTIKPYLNESILRIAQKNKKAIINVHNIRDWTTDKHNTVDDTPYGGGPGMIMKIEPLYNALQDIKNSRKKSLVILTSPGGEKFTQKIAKKYTKYSQIIIICGRYEGIDARIKEFIDVEISIGDYVLTGGEIPALVITDAITRLIPGVLGNPDSPEVETHSVPGYIEYPQYTKPKEFTLNIGKKKKTLRVPDVLLSGDHQKVAKWRCKKSSEK